MKAKVLYQTSQIGKPQFKTMDITKVGEKVYIADKKVSNQYKSSPLVYVIMDVNGILFVHQDTYKSTIQKPEAIKIAEDYAANYIENTRKFYEEEDYPMPARYIKLFGLLGEKLPRVSPL